MDTDESPTPHGPNPVRQGLVAGAIAAAITAILLLGFTLGGAPDAGLPRLLGYLALLIAILWSQFNLRRTEQAAIGYGDTLKVAVLASVAFTVVLTTYNIAHWTLIDPEAVERALAGAEVQLRAAGVPDEQLSNALTMQKMIVGPIITPLLGSIGTFIAGLLISLVTSAFMRRAPRD